MAPPLNRAWFDALIDDAGDGVSGTVWNKAAIDGLLDTIDLSLLHLGGSDTIYTECSLVGLGGTSGTTYSVKQLGYVKIGRLFVGTGRIAVSSLGTISGEIGIRLPFPSWGLWSSGGMLAGNVSGLAVPFAGLTGHVPGTWDICMLDKWPAAGGTASQFVYQTDLTNYFSMDFTIAYLATP